MMSVMEQSQQTHIQAKVFDFALIELVRNHRDDFQPLWTLDSWVKFLIWMTLNCGLSGDQESIQLFVDALGERLMSRMRRIFFERSIDGLALRLMADPSDPKVLVMPISGGMSVSLDQAEELLDQVGLIEKVQIEKRFWEELDAVIAIPWQSSNKNH